MTTSFGKETNALFGFSNMINKALEIIEPTHVMVAFDTGKKTFRHDRFDQYKGTRKSLPEELVQQFPLIREFLDASGILREEIVGYEADDIIGTMVSRYPDEEIVILSSDRDLLQLINKNASVTLMKKGLTEFSVMDLVNFEKEYGLEPKQIIDLKALMGDASDNIPGVPSVGEKTALKLITSYHSIDNLYDHIDETKGKLHDKLVEFKAQCYLSYDLATIYTQVPFTLNLDDCLLNIDTEALSVFYRKYEMNSLLNNLQKKSQSTVSDEIAQPFIQFDGNWFKDNNTIFVDIQEKDGFDVVIDGFAVSDGVDVCYLAIDDDLQLFHDYLQTSLHKRVIYSKPLYHYAYRNNLFLKGIIDDLSVLAFVVDSMVTTIDKIKDKYGLYHDQMDRKSQAICLARESADLFDLLRNALVSNDQVNLYESIEMPLIPVLAQCEYEGFTVDRSVLEKIAEETQTKIYDLMDQIFEISGHSFNLNSPKQMAEVLYDELGLPATKKRSTAVETLESLRLHSTIIDPILEYRKYQKLYSTYAVGLQKFIGSDEKIHTVLNQTATQTGRLSSTDPNLQNISVRNEETRKIRSAFIAEEGHIIVSVDYSQIELRMLAHLANEETLIDAFKNDIDIHTKTACDLFNVSAGEVTSTMRREAKTVNFGIIYGISEYGLAQQLGISNAKAKEYITRYLDMYSNINAYMQETIATCVEKGYVTTMFGRRREIPEIRDKNYAQREFGKRAAMNAPIQGSAADLIKLAMIAVDDILKKKKYQAKMLLQVHDELLFSVPFAEEERLIDDVVQQMTQVAVLKVPLEVSVNTGKTWFEAK